MGLYGNLIERSRELAEGAREDGDNSQGRHSAGDGDGHTQDTDDEDGLPRARGLRRGDGQRKMDIDTDDVDVRLEHMAHHAPPTEEEISLWRTRAFDCQKQLCDWQRVLVDVSDFVCDGDGDDEPYHGDVLNAMCSLNPLATTTTSSSSTSQSPNRRAKEWERLLPYYISSLVHGEESQHDQLITFVERTITDNHPLRPIMESTYATDIASAFAYKKDWARVRVYTDKAMTRFANSWRSLHPCAVGARRSLLQGLQRAVELDDAALYYASLTSRTHLTAEKDKDKPGKGKNNFSDSNGLLSLWERSHASPAVDDPVWVWDEIIMVRQDALASPGEPVGEREASHLSQLYFSTAAAALNQGVIEAVHPLLTKSARFKKGLSRRVGNALAEHQLISQFQEHKFRKCKLSKGITLLDDTESETDRYPAGMLKVTLKAVRGTDKALTKELSALCERNTGVVAAGLSTGHDEDYPANAAVLMALIKAQWLARWSAFARANPGDQPTVTLHSSTPSFYYSPALFLSHSFSGDAAAAVVTTNASESITSNILVPDEWQWQVKGEEALRWYQAAAESSATTDSFIAVATPMKTLIGVGTNSAAVTTTANGLSSSAFALSTSAMDASTPR